VPATYPFQPIGSWFIKLLLTQCNNLLHDIGNNFHAISSLSIAELSFMGNQDQLVIIQFERIRSHCGGNQRGLAIVEESKMVADNPITKGQTGISATWHDNRTHHTGGQKWLFGNYTSLYWIGNT